MRDAVQEIGGAVERVDDPAVGLVGAFADAAFLAEKAVAGPRLGQFLEQRLLGAAVGGGDEIRRALHRHLKFFHLTEIALEGARGLARSRDHHIERGGMGHRSGLIQRRGQAGMPAPARAVKASTPAGRGREPLPCRSFGSVAHGLRLLGGKSIEIGVLVAARLGDEVPLDRLGRIGGHAAPGHQNARQTVLRDGAAALGGLEEQIRGDGLVSIRAGAVERRDGELHHGVDIAGGCGRSHQLHGLAQVLRYAAAFFVHGGKGVLRLRIAGIRGLLEQLRGADQILRKLLALQVEQAEIVSGGGMAELCRGLKQTGTVRLVARAGAAFKSNMASANSALRSPFAAASLYHCAALLSSRPTP